MKITKRDVESYLKDQVGSIATGGREEQDAVLEVARLFGESPIFKAACLGVRDSMPDSREVQALGMAAWGFAVALRITERRGR